MHLLLGVSLGLAAMFMYGFAEIASTQAARKTTILRSNLWGWIIGTILLLLIFIFESNASLPQISIVQVLLATIAGVLSAFGYLAFYKGLRIGRASIVVPIADSSAIITVLLSFILLGETLLKLQVIGVAAIIFGTILVSMRGIGLESRAKGSYSAGINYALIAMACWGLMLFIIGFLIQTLGVIFPILLAAIAATLMNLLIAILARARLAFPKSAGKPIVTEAILSALGFLFYGAGANVSYIAIVAPIASASSFITVVSAMILLRERPSALHMVSIAILIVGIILTSF